MDSSDNLILGFTMDLGVWTVIKVPPLPSGATSVNTLFYTKTNIVVSSSNYAKAQTIIFDSLSASPTGYLVQSEMNLYSANNKGNYLIHLDLTGSATWGIQPPDQNY